MILMKWISYSINVGNSPKIRENNQGKQADESEKSWGRDEHSQSTLYEILKELIIKINFRVCICYL